MGRRKLLKARKLWRMADLALIVVVIAAAVTTAVLLWFPTGGDAVAVIAVGGEEVGRVRLSGVTAGYDLPLHTDPQVILRVEPGRVRFQKAGCPDQICVNTGWLTSPGQTAVCLPARASVRIEGAGGVDAVVR